MWAIQANVIHNTPNGSRYVQVPTFYLDENVQGITGERHAIAIAQDIINPLKLPDVEVHASACRV